MAGRKAENYLPFVRQARGYYSDYPIYAPVYDTGTTVLNVKSSPFFAAGDGITDDTDAIEMAIDALPLWGGEILFPDGVYMTRHTIVIKKHGVSLTGLPLASTFADQIQQQPGIRGLSVIKANPSWFSSGTPVVVYGELDNTKMWTGGGMYNLVVKNTKGFITPGDCVQILNVQAVTVQRCNLRDAARGVFVSANTPGGISNTNIRQNILNELVNNAIYMASGSEENYVKDNYIAGYMGYGIRVSGTGNSVINNHIESGLLIGSGTADGAAIYSDGSREYIYQNDIMNAPGTALYFAGSHGTVISNHINNANAQGIANGSGIWVAGSLVDVNITANSINDNDSHMVYGIRDTTTGGGVFIGPNSIYGYTTAPMISTNNSFQPMILPAKVGVGGVAIPTAALDMAASIAGAASMRVRSGVAPTTPNDGDIWYDGTNLKMRVGGVTKTFTLA